jgi:hypothetical protein
MDMKGSVRSIKKNNIKWGGKVKKVEVLRPYLIGFLDSSIEFRCAFNPNKVV